jgi:hypothetical protein
MSNLTEGVLVGAASGLTGSSAAFLSIRTVLGHESLLAWPQPALVVGMAVGLSALWYLHFGPGTKTKK